MLWRRDRYTRVVLALSLLQILPLLLGSVGSQCKRILVLTVLYRRVFACALMPCDCGLQIYTDAMIECARALSALLNGSPDNHLAMSSLGITAVAVSALDTIARVPLTRHPEHARRRIDDACEALSALMAVFCRHAPLPLRLSRSCMWRGNAVAMSSFV